MTQTDGMTPSEHVAQAAEYLEQAEQPVWTHPDRSSDKLPWTGGDTGLERHVNTFTRLASAHMQMASTKSLLQATQPQSPTMQRLLQPPPADPAVWPEPTAEQIHEP